MQLDNITNGQSFKNYKELCCILSIPVKGGKGKAYQLLDLKRYFDYTKEGNKFIINSIRDIPLDKIPRTYNPYGDLIQILLLDLLAQNSDSNNSLYLSTAKLLLYLSMINTRYTYYRYNIDKLHTMTKIDKKHLLEWYNLTHSTLKYQLENTLNILSSKALIHWTYSITLVSQRYQHYKADNEEIEFILDCEREILEELDCEDKHEVFKRGKWNVFIDKVNELLFNEWSVLYYYNSYEIVYNRNKDAILDEKERLTYLLTQYDRLEKQYTLNNIVINKLSDNSIKRVNKVADKHELELRKSELIRVEQNYIIDDKTITNILIKK